MTLFYKLNYQQKDLAMPSRIFSKKGIFSRRRGEPIETRYLLAYHRNELTLRDHLAIDRTTLANERTFLAYVRTALAEFVAGVSLINFFDYWLIAIFGWIFIPAGMLTLIAGLVRYQQMRTLIPGITNSNNNG